MILRLACVLALSLALSGCPEAEYLLTVDAKSDLEPGVDFVVVRTETARGPGAPFEELAQVGAFRGEDYLRGARVAEVSALSLGLVRLRVSLIDAGGEVVVQRTVSVQLRGSSAITVVLARRCAGEACGEELTCVNGRCVSPECGMDGAPPCPAPACDDAADCAAAACADAACASEACLVRPRDAECGDGERCDPVRGCVPGTGGACTPEGVACDDGDPCTSGDVCSDAMCRGTSYACTPGACETLECDGAGGCTSTPVTDCCGNGTCEAGETCAGCAADCPPTRVCDSCRAWDCCVVLGAVTRYDADCSACTPCDACAMASSCHTCAHPMGGDCRYDTQECNVRYEECNCRDECL